MAIILETYGAPTVYGAPGGTYGTLEVRHQPGVTREVIIRSVGSAVECRWSVAAPLERVAATFWASRRSVGAAVSGRWGIRRNLKVAAAVGWRTRHRVEAETGSRWTTGAPTEEDFELALLGIHLP